MNKEFVIDLIPQVGIYNTKKKKYQYFDIYDIPAKNDLAKKGFDLSDEKLRLIVKDDKEEKIAIEKLKEVGISFKKEGVFKIEIDKTKKGLVRIQTAINDKWKRCVSKIAFNYFVFILKHKNQQNLIYERDFDPIREYIRYDRPVNYEIFLIKKEPVLHWKSPKPSHNRWHLICLDWINYNSLLSKIKFFNFLTYSIFLCRNFRGFWRTISSGHIFNLNTRKIYEIRNFRYIIIP